MDPTVTYVGPQGKHLTGPDGAVGVEIQEYDDQGVPTFRTYGDVVDPPRMDLSSDPADDAVVDPDVTDAIKAGTWDLWVPGWAKPVDTVPELIVALGVDGLAVPDQRPHVAAFMELPAWQAAPPALASAVREWLEQTRPAA